jgi:proline racemase
MLTAIDTHTAGGPTRTLVAGLPPLPGNSVAEKMEYFRAHYDSVRKLLMLEPRGHRDMSGAVLTAPCQPGASVGAFFITSGGYLRACVHSSIGLATAGLETGFIPQESIASDGSVQLETPAGVVSLLPEYGEGGLKAVAVRTRPAFFCSEKSVVETLAGLRVEVSVAFSGVFFALVDARLLKAEESEIAPENAGRLSATGIDILDAANRQLEVRHPENPDLRTIDLVMFYEDLDDRHARDIVVGRSGGIDRSPCGAGTGAKMVRELALGRLKIDDWYTLDSFLGTRFTGRLVAPAQVGQFRGAVPEVTGSAYITGMHQFVLQADDPLREGFLF